MPLDLDCATIPMPEADIVQMAEALGIREREIIVQMYVVNGGSITRAEHPRSSAKPFIVTEYSPGHFPIGPGPLRTLLRRGFLLEDEARPERWTLSLLGKQVGYALYLDATLHTLRRLGEAQRQRAAV